MGDEKSGLLLRSTILQSMILLYLKDRRILDKVNFPTCHLGWNWFILTVKLFKAGTGRLVCGYVSADFCRQFSAVSLSLTHTARTASIQMNSTDFFTVGWISMAQTNSSF